jgi:hypothetical protein
VPRISPGSPRATMPVTSGGVPDGDLRTQRCRDPVTERADLRPGNAARSPIIRSQLGGAGRAVEARRLSIRRVAGHQAPPRLCARRDYQLSLGYEQAERRPILSSLLPDIAGGLGCIHSGSPPSHRARSCLVACWSQHPGYRARKAQGSLGPFTTAFGLVTLHAIKAGTCRMRSLRSMLWLHTAIGVRRGAVRCDVPADADR